MCARGRELRSGHRSGGGVPRRPLRSHRNRSRLLAGLVAAAMGLGKGKGKRIPVALVILVLGVVQLVRGFGIV